jgi:hypothetical protein
VVLTVLSGGDERDPDYLGLSMVLTPERTMSAVQVADDK